MVAREHPELDAALARAGDGVFTVAPDGRIVLWNRAAERLLGFTAREVLGKPCCDVFSGHDDKGNRLCYQGCHVRTLVKLGESVQNFDMRTRTKGGRPVWLNFSILTLPEGAPGGGTTIHLFRDVTSTKELLTFVHEKLAAAASGGEPSPASALTRREVEVLRLLAAGANTKAMADRLHVSPATIRNHVQNIGGKLGVHSRLEAVAYATRHRLL
ncbi:MAG TPA: LuxR C-terminal-related transcriptional regulator [Methylomirabilota bacterium]|nr:LuxR C-terminal-related transcriptional regulator [Methylomirabilota bacterium]